MGDDVDVALFKASVITMVMLILQGLKLCPVCLTVDLGPRAPQPTSSSQRRYIHLPGIAQLAAKDLLRGVSLLSIRNISSRRPKRQLVSGAIKAAPSPKFSAV